MKNARTDDPALMTQKHVGGYLDLLRVIPIHYGKSALDNDRTIQEILARAEDLEDDEIGLAAPTINRHRTQLGTILEFMDGHGFPIGVVPKKSRVDDPEGPEEKRAAFTVDDGVQLLATVDLRSREGSLADVDALFWVPALAWYALLRLSEAAGLAPEDVDLAAGLIHVRPNNLRRVKTRSSKRTLPIPPELLRLGFPQFVAFRQREESKHLFPGLFGKRSNFAVVFQKIWAPILDQALPSARQDRKTLHSTRKGGNSAIISGRTPATTRLYVMGHAKLDTNGRHYSSPPSVDEMLDALRCIPIVTSSLQARTLD